MEFLAFFLGWGGANLRRWGARLQPRKSTAGLTGVDSPADAGGDSGVMLSFFFVVFFAFFFDDFFATFFGFVGLRFRGLSSFRFPSSGYKGFLANYPTRVESIRDSRKSLAFVFVNSRPGVVMSHCGSEDEGLLSVFNCMCSFPEVKSPNRTAGVVLGVWRFWDVYAVGGFSGCGGHASKDVQGNTVWTWSYLNWHITVPSMLRITWGSGSSRSTLQKNDGIESLWQAFHFI